MNNSNLDKYLDIANLEKKKRGIEEYIPLYPMVRIVDNKLYVVVMFVKQEDEVWNVEGNVKPEYWLLIDTKTDEVIEFNKTAEKDFILGEIVSKKTNDKQKRMSIYSIEKTLEYKNYLINDIKNEQLPLQKKLSDIIGNEVEIDGEKVDLNEYLLANFEEEIKNKVNELVDILIQSKYGSITYYYDNLINDIVKEYNTNGNINKDKIALCVEIMNNYYDGVIGIDNIFNI